jgi:hypothetical protein
LVFGSSALGFLFAGCLSGVSALGICHDARTQLDLSVWIHTKIVRKLPDFFEFVLNTPSHHRVHHGVNDLYLDKNYAGIFIFWDRMFGTFVEENEEVRYGIITPLTSYNPLWINSHGWAEMWAAMRTKRTFFGKLRCVFGAPAMDFEEKILLDTNQRKQI